MIEYLLSPVMQAVKGSRDGKMKSVDGFPVSIDQICRSNEKFCTGKKVKRRLVKTLSAILLGLLASTLIACPTSAQTDVRLLPAPKPTFDVPDYSFENEETGFMSWELDGPRASKDHFAYLTLDEGQDRFQRRALILVDSTNPEKAFFLEGKKLVQVSEVAGKSIEKRIDTALTESALLVRSDGVIPNRVITIRVAGISGPREPVEVRFTWALADFSKKFEAFPCLALPYVLKLTRGGKTVEFIVLLRREDAESNLVSHGCDDFTPPISSPMFSYIEPARLHFAFTKKRFVIQHRNYIISIPYDLDDEMIERSSHLVTKRQLDKILNDVFISDGSSRQSETPQVQIERAGLIQHSIDFALTTLLNAKGEKQ